jgi:hypothetical protein
MTDLLPETLPPVETRIAGARFVVCIAAGFFAELIVRSRLVDFSNAATTADNILASQAMSRLAVLADLATFACAIAIAALLYEMLKPVSRRLAIAAIVFAAVSTMVSIGTAIHTLTPWLGLADDTNLRTSAPEPLPSLALLGIKLYTLAFALDLALFGASCLLAGYFIFRSAWLPRILGALLALAGLTYLCIGLVPLTASALTSYQVPYVLSCLA